MLKRREKICGVTLFSIGLLALAGGIVVFFCLPIVIRQRVDNDVALKEGSFAERTWERPPFGIAMQFWLFNVTNADDVLKHGMKPILFQKGPYGFRETQVKENLEFSPGNHTNAVSYVNRKEYFWDTDLSCSTCGEMDEFTVPNMPYLTALKLLKEGLPAFIAYFLEALLRKIGGGPFVANVKAHELLFDGYKDEIFDLINRLKPGAVPAKMGLFYGRNSTNDGLYLVNTGAGGGDIGRVGRVEEWENRTNLSWTGWWRSEYPEASMINGSDGTVYPPFLERTSVLPMFIRDLCRSIYVTYESDVTYRGMRPYRFTTPPELFDANVSSNLGFCWPSAHLYYNQSIQPREDGGWCLPSGMLDMSKCQQGAPLVVTAPQFASCPDEVKDSVEGLYPESAEFRTFLDIEPTTGVVLAGARKIQLNVAMHASLDPKAFQNMHSAIVPIVWLNESVQIDDRTYEYLYTNVVTIKRASYIGSIVAMALGACLLIILLVLIIYLFIFKKDSDQSGLLGGILPESTAASISEINVTVNNAP